MIEKAQTARTTITLPVETMRELDEWCGKFHCTRNALITIWLGQTMASMKAAYNSIPTTMQDILDAELAVQGIKGE